jgi:hypothetical protein
MGGLLGRWDERERSAIRYYIVGNEVSERRTMGVRLPKNECRCQIFGGNSYQH